MKARTAEYDLWLMDVRAAVSSINMPFDDWQAAVPFDFGSEFKVGTDAVTAATKANRFWWRNQNQRINQDCRLTPDCWLPRGHSGACEQV